MTNAKAQHNTALLTLPFPLPPSPQVLRAELPAVDRLPVLALLADVQLKEDRLAQEDKVAGKLQEKIQEAGGDATKVRGFMPVGGGGQYGGEGADKLGDGRVRGQERQMGGVTLCLLGCVLMLAVEHQHKCV